MNQNPKAETTVGVLGLGYVGLPLALSMADAGYQVIGVDIDEERVASLKEGNSYITDVKDQTLQRHLNDGFTPSNDYKSLSDVDGVSVCVPTPLRKTGQPDVSTVIDATERLSDVIPHGATVIMESTVYPGATEEIVAPTLAENGYEVGEDVFVAFSPERIDPGNEEYGPRNIPKVLGGITDACGDRAEALYQPVFDEVFRVDSTTEAELSKLLENTFRSVNIALVNKMATIAYELDADIWNVIEAAKTKPFGFMPFYPGPGLGGHCIPIDPHYLSWKASQQGIDTQFIDIADSINRQMPNHVVDRIVSLLNEAGTPLPESQIMILGAAYKPNVSDTRESPALDIITLLKEKGATVQYHDPHVPKLELPDGKMESTPIGADRLQENDCVIIVTDHDDIDYQIVVEHAPLVFDTRNATSGIMTDNVYKL